MFVLPELLEEIKRTYMCSLRKNIYKFASHVKCDRIIKSSTDQDNQPNVIINRAQFGICRPSSFQLVNKDKSNMKKGKNSYFIV